MACHLFNTGRCLQPLLFNRPIFGVHFNHPLGANYDVIPDHLQTELAKGYTFADMSSHGADMCFGHLEQETLYLNDHAASLNNTGYTVITTISCSTNAFDLKDACLSEAFIRNPNSGILAYLGSSREGWVTTSFEYDSIFYKKILLRDDHRFAPAVRECKDYFLSHYNSYNKYRWLLFTLNPLGDPEMPVFLSIPQLFENVSISIANNQVTVNTGINNCDICVSSANDFGDNYYQTASDVNSYTFNNVNGECYVSVTKTGYIPYVARISPQSLYIQNETFTGNSHFLSNDIYIGSNVTTNKPYGPVIIENGSTIINHTGTVSIQNDFEVRQGAKFEVLPNN